ncbi:unnamed protein product [Malus baccata var. baccata]
MKNGKNGTSRAGWRMKRPVTRRRQECLKRLVLCLVLHRIPAAGEATQKTLARFKDGTLERMELSPQELRPRFPHLPSVWKPSWVDPEVCADVLQAVLPQQCQGDWLHQVSCGLVLHQQIISYIYWAGVVLGQGLFARPFSMPFHALIFASGFWVLPFVLATVLVFFLSVSSSRNGSLFPDSIFNHHADGPKMIVRNRKLKESGNAGNVNLDDYQPIDPSPSSKASIKPGPIEHGAPIIPYIPKPSPPARPNPGGWLKATCFPLCFCKI